MVGPDATQAAFWVPCQHPSSGVGMLLGPGHALMILVCPVVPVATDRRRNYSTYVKNVPSAYSEGWSVYAMSILQLQARR